MPDHSARLRSRRPVRAATTEFALVVAGLIAAVASGVIAYRAVGPYADGPINVGLYRTQDPETGTPLVYRQVRQTDGALRRYLFDDGSRTLKQIQVIRMIDGKVETVGLHMGDDGLRRVDAGGHTVERDATSGISKVGFSVRNNNVIDAWAYRDVEGRLMKIEVSRRQDGQIDRWEYYEDDQLGRVEEDDNRDGKPDRWLTFEAGILVSEARDRDGDGKPDPGR